jgi:hypothetical protein
MGAAAAAAEQKALTPCTGRSFSHCGGQRSRGPRFGQSWLAPCGSWLFVAVLCSSSVCLQMNLSPAPRCAALAACARGCWLQGTLGNSFPLTTLPLLRRSSQPSLLASARWCALVATFRPSVRAWPCAASARLHGNAEIGNGVGRTASPSLPLDYYYAR